MSLTARAVAYLRMSTDLQEYSTENQLACIRVYATQHGFEILRLYVDEGISGLTLSERKALQAVISEVNSGAADFNAILVYDISRWGRFQQPDEAGYYEHMCARAGVQVHYCAEVFSNDGGFDASVMKAIKRGMAAEFSREQSSRIFNIKAHMTKAGFRAGGYAGYGFRRLVIDRQGVPQKVLEMGERKANASHRIVLVPGPQDEIDTIKRIFRMYVYESQSMMRIAALLNREGVPHSTRSRIWTMKQVRQILGDEKYIGACLYNRVSRKLKGRAVRNDESEWIKTSRAYEPIVSEELFQRAHELIELRPSSQKLVSDEKLLSMLRDVLKREGALSASIISADPKMPPVKIYNRRFGGLQKAYRLIGYSQPGFAELQAIKQARR